MPRKSRFAAHVKKGALDPKHVAARDKTAREAAEAELATVVEAMGELASPAKEAAPAEAVVARPNSCAQEERRRQAIVWKFDALGSPPQEEWSGVGATSCATPPRGAMS